MSSKLANLTVEQFQKALPRNIKHNATQETLDIINNNMLNPSIRQSYRDNLLSYTNVMQDGRFQIGKYIDAVRYITHKLMGYSNIQAFVQTFPDRYQSYIDEGCTSKIIANYISAYNKNKLVNLIFEQTLVPTYILNADLHQKALNVQAALMINEDVSPKVRSDAANSLLTHLKMPETTKIELDIGIKEDKVIDELRQSTLDLVAQQRKMLEAGAMTAKEVAHSKLRIIDGESEVISN